MIFQYDPLNYHIESDDERSLLITINRLENISPRIRYNIHDRGLTLSVERARAALRDHGVALDPAVDPIGLPLLLHWGRQDSSVGFYGCKITPEDIQHVILRLPQLASKVANFALHPYEDEQANKRLELWFELERGVTVDEAGLRDVVLHELALVNQDYREAARMIPGERRPSLVLFPFGESPISGQDIRIKKRYIV